MAEPVRLYSRLLGEYIICVEGKSDAPVDATDVVFTREEIMYLKDAGQDAVKAVFRAKKFFGGWTEIPSEWRIKQRQDAAAERRAEQVVAKPDSVVDSSPRVSSSPSRYQAGAPKPIPTGGRSSHYGQRPAQIAPIETQAHMNIPDWGS